MPVPHAFKDIIPALEPWVDSLATDPLANALQNWFAEIEIVHFLGLFSIAACVIAVSLRLLGVGIREASPSEVWRNTRVWLHIGMIAAIGSGLLMGLSNADKLYKNTAFFWKMIAMTAAIVFSYAVLIPTAKADGNVPGRARLALAIGAAAWGLSILVMLANRGGNVGAIHLMTAAIFLGLAVLKGHARWLFLTLAAAAVIALQVVTHWLVTDPFSELFMTINKVWMWTCGLALLAFVATQALRTGHEPTTLSRLVGYAAILAWVTVGAGGRWIGYT
jgi:hypothetical protein